MNPQHPAMLLIYAISNEPDFYCTSKHPHEGLDLHGKSYAEALATIYHNQHGGWKRTWPLEITFLRKLGTIHSRYKVERHIPLKFTAKSIPIKNNTLYTDH